VPQIVTSGPYLSVVIPAYNEAEAIAGVVAESLAALADAKYSYELVVVDDGSTDATGKVLQDLQARNACVRACSNPTNLGLGAALKTGFRNCRGEVITWIPGDGQYDLNHILAVLPQIRDCDIIVAIREGVRHSWRAIISWCFHLLVLALFRFRATDICGIYVLRRDLLEQIKPRANNIFLNLEIPILCLKHGKHLKQFVIPLRPRRAGVSKVANAKTLTKNVLEMIRIRFSRSN
jgi:glycosyltransferase involved in cell wall biosynthesis